MSIKLNKESYEKLIKEDLDFLNKHCPDGPELDHIKLIVCGSIDWHYPKGKHMCLRDKSKVCNLCHDCDVCILNPSY